MDEPTAASAPERVRIDADPRRHAEQALADLSLLALSEVDVPRLLTATVESVRQALDADFASVLELLPGGEGLRLRAGSGWEDVQADVVSELDSASPVAQALLSEGPVLVDHSRSEHPLAADSLLGLHGVASSAAMVIRGREQPFGAVSVHSRRAGAFGPADLVFLRAAANILAAAMARYQVGKMERQLAAIVETSLDAIVGRTPEGIVTSWNAAAEQLFGYTAEEMIGRNIDILAPPERSGELEAVNVQLLRGDVVQQFETVRVRKDGRRIDVASTVSPIRDASGRIVAASAISRDITARRAAQDEMRRLLEAEWTARASERQAQVELQQSEEQYRLLFQNNPTPMWVFDSETWRFLAVNEAAVENYGYARDEFLSMTIDRIRRPEDVPRLREALASTATAPTRGKVQAERWQHLRKDGTVIDVDISSHDTLFEGRAARVVLATDITERRAAEDALRASEARYRDLFENANDLIATVDLDEHLTSANAAFVSTLGYSREELLGRKLLELVPPEWHRRMNAATGTKLDGHERETRHEHELIARDGRRITVEAASRLIVENGSPVGIQAICRDVTARRAAERALRESEELYRLVVENSMDMIAIFDRGARLVYASPSHLDVLGHAPEDMVGLAGSEFIHPDDLEAATAAFSAAWHGSRACPAGMIRLRHRDGHYVRSEGTATPIADGDGNPRLVLATYHDVTDRARAEELADQLRQSQKMEAIGRLAGGIAHDFNNLLTVISGYSEIALARDDPTEIHRAIEEVVAAAKSAAALTGQLLVFSRQQVSQPEVLDVGSVIADTERLLRRLLGEDVTLIVAVDPGLRPIEIDPSQLEQVLLNLAVNAREAMPEGGTLSIAAESVEVDEAYASSQLGLDPGACTRLTVRDTGTGMDEETVARVFEPFFTTKAEGTGLGLATVHGIVTQSNGHVSVSSEPGAGTIFRLLFPAVEHAPVRSELPTAEPGGTVEGTTILVVEDEESVRRLTTRILVGEGYTVLAAGTPDEAVDVAAGWTAALDLILSDVRLPGRPGPELADELRAVHPEARLLFISGYAEGEGAADPLQPFLAKPFTAAGLAAKVSEVLAA